MTHGENGLGWLLELGLQTQIEIHVHVHDGGCGRISVPVRSQCCNLSGGLLNQISSRSRCWSKVKDQVR